MRLNWFSPLPPARTEIANYTAGLLPYLCRRAEVTLWTDQADWDPALEQQAEVRRFDPGHGPWPAINRADISFFNLGNNALYHGGIWQVSRQHPGAVILHDLRLHDLFYHLYLGRKQHTGYLSQMIRCYGSAGAEAAEAFMRGELPPDHMAERFPLVDLACENAAGVVVHTHQTPDWAGPANGCPVLYAPLPCAATPRQTPSSTAAPLPDGSPYRLIVFGHISRNRRLDAILDALAAIPGRDRFCLDVYGTLADADLLRARVRALGLGGRVRLHGFVPQEEMEAALAWAHLAINLRYPTMGEASASQLRIWDHALPSLVTPVGWYATIPAGAADFVHPDTEVADLAAHLEAFLADPARYVRQGEAGRRVLERDHSPEAYAAAVVGFAERARAFRPRAAAHYLAERAGEEMSAWAAGGGPARPFRRVAEQIHRLV
jgi:glycosyltransferase involved in cell wall biosynthesis